MESIRPGVDVVAMNRLADGSADGEVFVVDLKTFAHWRDQVVEVLQGSNLKLGEFVDGDKWIVDHLSRELCENLAPRVAKIKLDSYKGYNVNFCLFIEAGEGGLSLDLTKA